MPKLFRSDITTTLVRTLLFLLVGVLISKGIQILPSIESFNSAWVDAHTRNNGVQGILNFVAFSVILVSIGVPRQLIAFMGGYAFGIWQGVLFSTIATTISCLLVLSLSRLFARHVFSQILTRKLQLLEGFLSVQPFVKTLMIRLFPVGNNLLTNVLAGLARINIARFLLGSFVGYLPQMIIFALMGKGVVVQSNIKIITSASLLLIFSLLGLYLYKNYSVRNEADCHKQLALDPGSRNQISE